MFQLNEDQRSSLNLTDDARNLLTETHVFTVWFRQSYQILSNIRSFEFGYEAKNEDDLPELDEISKKMRLILELEEYYLVEIV